MIEGLPVTRVPNRSHGTKRPAKAHQRSGKPQAASATRIEVLDNIDELRQMNDQLKESLAKTVKTSKNEEDQLWADVQGEKEDHHLGAGLNGRWF